MWQAEARRVSKTTVIFAEVHDDTRFCLGLVRNKARCSWLRKRMKNKASTRESLHHDLSISRWRNRTWRVRWDYARQTKLTPDCVRNDGVSARADAVVEALWCWRPAKPMRHRNCVLRKIERILKMLRYFLCHRRCAGKRMMWRQVVQQAMELKHAPAVLGHVHGYGKRKGVQRWNTTMTEATIR